MYREHDSNGLSKLNAETDNSYVHFRNMLLNGTSEDIKNLTNHLKQQKVSQKKKN